MIPYQTLFIKHSRYLILLPVALLAVALGNLITSQIAVFLEPAPALLQSGAPVALPTQQTARIQHYDLIQRRNIFHADSTRNAGALKAEPEETAQGAAPSSATSAVNTNEALTLIGTIEGADVSMALIELEGESQTYRLGEATPGGGTLLEIGRKWVLLRYRDGSEVRLELPEEGAGKPARTSARPARTAAAPAPSAASNLYSWPQIVSTGENSWRIAQSEADRARTNLSELLKQARLVPRTVNGQTEGFMVAMIRPNSFLSALGIKRGDTIVGVNGLDLDSPEKALQIFQQLREARQLSLSLVRAGQNMTFEYEID